MLLTAFAGFLTNGVDSSGTAKPEGRRSAKEKAMSVRHPGELKVEETVKEAGAPLLDDLGLELWDVHWGGGRLRLTVDRKGGVDSQALALASRTISAELDVLDPIPGRYTLEVSSPGIERKLRRPEHFKKSVGLEVSVKLAPGQEGARRVRGCLTEAADSQITLTLPDGERQVIPMDSVTAAKTVFDWDEAGKLADKRVSGSEKGKKAG